MDQPGGLFLNGPHDIRMAMARGTDGDARAEVQERVSIYVFDDGPNPTGQRCCMLTSRSSPFSSRRRTTGVVTVHTYDTLDKAVSLFLEHKFGCLPVLDKTETLVGIVSPLDLLRAFEDLAPKALRERKNSPD